jgi:hypothetical protein
VDKKLKSGILAMLIICLYPLFPLSVAAEDSPSPVLGYTLDMLPVILSASEGRAGYSFQVWAGLNRIKIRVIGAHLLMPQSMIKDSFEDYEVNVAAILIDYFFTRDLRGFWIGSGVELWNSSVKHKKTGETALFTDSIITAGGGYVWHLTEHVYLNPFAALHFRINDSKVLAGNEEFTRKKFSSSASVKIGYRF